MKQKTLSGWLKGILVITGICGLVVYLWIIPEIADALLQRAPDRFLRDTVFGRHQGTAGKAVPFFQFTNSDFGGDVKGHLRINRRFIRMLHSVAAVPFVDFIIEYHEGVKKSNSFMISVLIPPQGHQINCGSMRPEWHIIAVVGKKAGSTAINTRR